MVAAILLASMTVAVRSPSIAATSARLEVAASPSSSFTVAVVGLPAPQVERLRSTSDGDWSQWLSLHVSDPSNPPVAARYAVVGGRVELRPRFPLEGGLGYVAVFRPAALAEWLGSEPAEGVVVERRFEVPRPAVTPTTLVERVTPSRGVVPENLLKFYVHFSAPMTRGRAYRYLRIVDARGEEVELAFLELEYELWDPDTRRLTLLFDPGRLKAGLKPRREVGPALQGGFDFALEVDADWPDAEGNPLREGFRHAFRVVPPDHEQPDPDRWTWSVPKAGTRQPLVIGFGEPLDAALLQHSLWVVENATERQVPGSIELGEGETSWRFTPAAPWRSNEHELRVDVLLEDLAGNSIARPFEVDLSAGSGSAQSSGRGAELWSRSFVPTS